MRIAAIILLGAMLAACQPAGGPEAGQSKVYDGIGADETLHFTGTEPFWGGEIVGTSARYNTPENIDGTRFMVKRFAGNNGVSFSGQLDGARFDLIATPGECSDGMSDRSYPFVVTLMIGKDRREGCGYTDAQPFTGPANP
ncbi:COG3650 family protein [Qipengyuania marisflavi]|uniref:Lipoprotein n=1 Tax=Qipengyuania marisflavi TaxID=2486356 RepID=A0A5S3P1D8_9SPHN|nr:hypothetical protein [Qipengyuania marisflavi]TMM46720.1 hypothetical protein FEV51_10835 [Qipengyuania marisflavi]